MNAPCPICRGTGFEIRTRPDGVSTAAPCSCDVKDRGERLLRLARFPRRYDHCTLERFEEHHDSHREARTLAVDWIERWPCVGHGLLFVGPPGTGKTHLAVAIARELVLRKGARVLFYEQRELLKSLQGTFDPAASRSESEVLAPVQKAEVLVLDDLGAGRTTEWGRDVLHEILTFRYNQTPAAAAGQASSDGLPLIMTSNRPLEARMEARMEARGAAGRDPAAVPGLSLDDRLGSALLSRIYEMCRVVVFQGDDYRRGVLNAEIART